MVCREARFRETFLVKFVPFARVCQLELGSDRALPLSLDRRYAITRGRERWFTAPQAIEFPPEATKDEKRRAVRDAES